MLIVCNAASCSLLSDKGFPAEDLKDLRLKVEADMQRNKGGPMVFSAAEVAVVRLLAAGDL